MKKKKNSLAFEYDEVSKLYTTRNVVLEIQHCEGSSLKSFFDFFFCKEENIGKVRIQGSEIFPERIVTTDK